MQTMLEFGKHIDANFDRMRKRWRHDKFIKELKAGKKIWLPIEPTPGTDQHAILELLKNNKTVLGSDFAQICIDYRRRICDLREKGWNILDAKMIRYTDSRGKIRKIGEYRLK